jgi:hypothetical protein
MLPTTIGTADRAPPVVRPEVLVWLMADLLPVRSSILLPPAGRGQGRRSRLASPTSTTSAARRRPDDDPVDTGGETQTTDADAPTDEMEESDDMSEEDDMSESDDMSEDDEMSDDEEDMSEDDMDDDMTTTTTG